MRVLHYCETFSETSETFIYDYVKGIEEVGAESAVVCHGRANKASRPHTPVYTVDMPHRWHPLRVWHRLRLSSHEDPSRASFWPQLRSQLRQAIQTDNPDLIHAQFGTVGAIMRPVARELGVPLVVHFRGYDVSKILPSPFWEKEYEKLFRDADCLIGISNHICRKIKALGADSSKIRMLHTGVHIEKFKYDPPWLRFNDNTVRCLHVGRMVEKKAPCKLIHAFARARELVSEDGLALQLTVAGDGPLLKDAVRLASSLEIKDDVTFLGSVPNTQVQELMRTHHLHVKHCVTASDGDQEGQGVTFAEASAVGLPIVTTRHNGIPDVVVDGKTGFLVGEHDVERMAERISYLATHPEQWQSMGEAGRAHIEEHFDVDKQIRKLVGLYQDVIN